MKQWDDIHKNFRKITEKISDLEPIRHIGEIFRQAGTQLLEFGDISYVLSCSFQAREKRLQIESISGISSNLELAIQKIFHQDKAPYVCRSGVENYRHHLKKNPIYLVQKGLSDILSGKAEAHIIRSLEEAAPPKRRISSENCSLSA